MESLSISNASSSSSSSNQQSIESPSDVSIRTSSTASQPPSIVASTPNNNTFSILPSRAGPSNLSNNKGSKRSLSSHQALLRSGPKVSSASAVGVGARISSYGLTPKNGLSSSSGEETTKSMGDSASTGSPVGAPKVANGSLVDESRLEGLKFLSNPPPFSPEDTSGDLDRPFKMKEEGSKAIDRIEFNSSASTTGSQSPNSPISPTTLVRKSPPAMLRADSNGSASTASLSPSSEKSFCFSEGGRSCGSGITTPGPSPYRKEFNLGNDFETESRHTGERGHTYSDSTSLSDGKSNQNHGRSSEPNVGYSSSNSLVRGRPFRSSSVMSSIASTTFDSYPKHVRRSTFGRDSKTGRWLFSSTTTPTANISSVFNHHPPTGKSGQADRDIESTQIHQSASELLESDVFENAKKSKGLWRNSFNWESSVPGEVEHQNWDEDGEISPKKVTFGAIRDRDEPSRKLAASESLISKMEELSNELEVKERTDATPESSRLLHRACDLGDLEWNALQLKPQNSKASTESNSLSGVEVSSNGQDQQKGVESYDQLPLPPAYLRKIGRITTSEKLINQFEKDQVSNQSRDERTSLPLVSSRGRAQSSPNSAHGGDQAETRKEAELHRAPQPSIPSSISIDVPPASNMELEVDVFHLPSFAIKARAVAMNALHSPPILSPSSSSTSFSSTFPFMVADVDASSGSSSGPRNPQNPRKELLRTKSERDVGDKSSILTSSGNKSAAFSTSSTQQVTSSWENRSTTEAHSPIGPARARAVSASSAILQVGGGSRLPPQASPRGKFTSKFKGRNLELGLRNKGRGKRAQVVQDVVDKKACEGKDGISVPKDSEKETQVGQLEEESGGIEFWEKESEGVEPSFTVFKSNSQIAFSQVSTESTPRQDLSDPFETDSQVGNSSPSAISFLTASSSSASSESARHISARALASRLMMGETNIKRGNSKVSHNALATSNPRFAKAISAAHQGDTDGEDSDGYSSETPVPTPQGLTPLSTTNPIETALSNGLAITPPLESSSASSTPIRSTFQPEEIRPIEKSKQVKRGSYPFGLARPSNSNPPSPLELPDLLLASIPSAQSDNWSIKSRECLAALEMDSNGAEWGAAKLKALEKGWKRRTVAGVLGTSSSFCSSQPQPGDTEKAPGIEEISIPRSFSTPSSIFSRIQAERSLLEGATEARTSSRHKSWAPERFGEELENLAKRGGGREFSKEEAKIAMNAGRVLQAVKEDSRETSFEIATSSDSSRPSSPSNFGVQSPRPPRPPKSALRMLTSPKIAQKLPSKVSLHSRAASANYDPIPPLLEEPTFSTREKGQRRSLPAQISCSGPLRLAAPMPRSPCRPAFFHSDSQSSDGSPNPLSTFIQKFEEKEEVDSGFMKPPTGLGLKFDSVGASNSSLDPSTPKFERRHSRIPSLSESGKNSLDNVVSLSKSVASGLINPLHSPLASAAVSTLSSPTSRTFSPAQLRQSLSSSSLDIEEAVRKLEPYRVTPRPEGVALEGDIP